MFRRDRFLYLSLLLFPSYLMPAQAVPYILQWVEPAFKAVAATLISKGYTSYTGRGNGDQFSIGYSSNGGGDGNGGINNGYSSGGTYKTNYDLPPALRDTTAHKNVNTGSGTNRDLISYDEPPTREDYFDKNNILDVEAYNQHAEEYSRRREKLEKAKKSDLEAIKMAEKAQAVIDTCKDNHAKEKSRIKIEAARERFKLKEKYYQDIAAINAEAINKAHDIDPSSEQLMVYTKEFKKAVKNRDICRINAKKADEYLTNGHVTDTELSPAIQDLIRVSNNPLVLYNTENNNDKPSDNSDYDPSKDPKKFRRPKKSDERAQLQRPDPRSEGKDLNLPDPSKAGQANHIIAPRAGHIAKYTPGAVAVLKAAYKLGTYLGEDAMGNFHYVWTNPDDGYQIWLKVRDCGKLHDGGANTNHWGLSKHGFLEKPFDMSKEIKTGVTYVVGGIVINAAYEGSGLKAKVDDYFKGETPEQIKERMDKQRENILAMQKTKMDYYQDVFDQIRKDYLSDPEKAAKLMKDKMTGPSFDVKTKEQVPLKNVAIMMAQRKLNPEPTLSDMLKDLKPEPVAQPSAQLPVSFKMPTAMKTSSIIKVEDSMRLAGYDPATVYKAASTKTKSSSKRSSSSDDDDSSASSSGSHISEWPSTRWESKINDSWGSRWDSNDSDSSSSSSDSMPPSPGPNGAPPSGY